MKMNVSYQNATVPATHYQESQQGRFSIVKLCLFSFSFVVSTYVLLSNALVLTFLYKLKIVKLRRRISGLICLSLCDVFVGLGALLYTFTRVFELFHKAHRYNCAVVLSIIEIGITLSLFHTFCICLERFLAVRSNSPVKHYKTYKNRAFSFLLSFVFIAFFAACWKVVTVDPEFCGIMFLYGTYYKLYAKVFSFLLWVPLLIATVILYIATALNLQSKMKQIKALPDCPKINEVTAFADQRTRFNSENTSKTNLLLQVPEIRFGSRNGDRIDRFAVQSSSVFYIHENRVPSTSQSLSKLHAKSTDLSVNSQREVCDRMKTSSKTRTGHTNGKVILSGGQKHVVAAMKTIGLIVFVLVLTTGTAIMSYAVDSLCESCEVTGTMRYVMAFIAVLNSAINPIVYFATIKEFRKGMKTIICCQGN